MIPQFGNGVIPLSDSAGEVVAVGNVRQPRTRCEHRSRLFHYRLHHLLGGVMGHNIPPVNFMALTGEQLITEYYAKYPGIATDMIVSAFFGGLYLPWVLPILITVT